MTNVKLHGLLGDFIGKKEYYLSIKSAGEAIRAIHILSGKRLFPFLQEKDKENIKYQVLINGRPFETEKKLTIENIEDIKTSELCLKNPNIKTIDIIPVIEGMGGGNLGSILSIVAGVILIAVGFWTGIGTVMGAALIVGGLGLVAAGVINLLTQPPKFDDFEAISGNRRSSYLFEGSQNVAREGLPIPVVYGRLLVGSVVVSATYEVSDIPADLNELTV